MYLIIRKLIRVNETWGLYLSCWLLVGSGWTDKLILVDFVARFLVPRMNAVKGTEKNISSPSKAHQNQAVPPPQSVVCFIGNRCA